MNEIRLKLIASVTMLDAFNNASSHARLEQKLNLLISEVRAGKREGSVVSTTTFESVDNQSDRQIWKALRRDLEDVGILPDVIVKKRSFIVAWFRDAIAAGRLEEDSPSGDDDDDDDDDRRIVGSQTATIQTDMSTNAQGTASGLAAPTFKSDVETKSISDAQSESGTLYPPVDSHRPQGKKRSRLRVTYLLNRMRGTQQQLLKAVGAGDELAMLDLLLAGVNVNAEGLQKSALHCAAWEGNKRMVKLLLDKGASVESRWRDGKDMNEGLIPLMLAAEEGDLVTTELLLDAGSDVNATFTYLNKEPSIARSVLDLAADRGQHTVVRLLLDRGARIDSQALTRAAWRGQLEAVRVLLDRGANVEQRDGFGETALMAAIDSDHDHVEVIQLLLDRGADIETKHSCGYTALSNAASKGRNSIVRLLLDQGADVESKRSFQRTALMKAAAHGHDTTARLLLQRGANIDRQVRGRTALIQAASQGHESMVKLLLEEGADAGLVGQYRDSGIMGTAAFHAGRKGHKKVKRLQVEKEMTTELQSNSTYITAQQTISQELVATSP